MQTLGMVFLVIGLLMLGAMIGWFGFALLSVNKNNEILAKSELRLSNQAIEGVINCKTHNCNRCSAFKYCFGKEETKITLAIELDTLRGELR